MGVIPQDDLIYEYDCAGKPTSQIPEDSPVKTALREIMGKLEL